jgi:hypothetical protein
VRSIDTLSSKQQAASSKQQAASSKQQAASSKQQAASSKQQATSNKQQATSNKQQATSNKQQATSNKQQATSNKQQATIDNLLFDRRQRGTPRSAGNGKGIKQAALIALAVDDLVQDQDGIVAVAASVHVGCWMLDVGCCTSC